MPERIADGPHYATIAELANQGQARETLATSDGQDIPIHEFALRPLIALRVKRLPRGAQFIEAASRG